MAKNLSERIADRMRNKKATVSAQNRGAFLALKGEIIQAIEDRWPVKQIWETLHDEGKVTFSYQAFRNYVNSLILAPKQRSVSKPPAEAPRTEGQVSNVKKTVPEKPRTPVSAVSPVQQPAATGFNFDAKPKKEDYI
ncbi:TraK family protein [Pseudomonas sp. S2.OTC.A_B10]|uniref:TraK family protein n=1 Tax=Pseudomonas sp. S2.OTC.A_B10 TaxID=3237018 RepID=UPI003CEAD9C5